MMFHKVIGGACCACLLAIAAGPALAQGHGTAVYTAPPPDPNAPARPLEVKPRAPFFKAFEGKQPDLKITDEALISTIGKAMAGSGAPTEFDDTKPLDTPVNPENPAIPAGFTFFGQFLDHDITKTELCPERQGQTCNVRTASFDLDSVYGLGFEKTISLLVAKNEGSFSPIADADCAAATSEATVERCLQKKTLSLYEMDGTTPAAKPTGKLRIDVRAGPIEDLPRDPAANNAAIIGDPRNDENTILAQLHLKFLQAHNKLYEQKRTQLRVPANTFNRAAFEYARRTLTQHYQGIIKDDYLSRILNDRNREPIFRASFPEGFHFYPESRCSVDHAEMPFEFAGAAFRFGHSQVRNAYKLNEPQNPFPIAALFVPQPLDETRKIEWRRFFETDEANAPTRSMAIDTVLSPGLSQLTQPGIPLPCQAGSPAGTCDIKPDAYRTVLASRNVDTGHHSDTAASKSRGIPITSGKLAATQLRTDIGGGVRVQLISQPALASTHMGRRFPTTSSLSVDTLPLWVYVLAEAELQERGTRLGDIGSVMVGETFMALLSCDERSIISERWVPTLPRLRPHLFTMADLIRFAEPPAN